MDNRHEMLGMWCRKFRNDVLNKTLAEVQGSHKNIKALSAFEHGRSTNYEHVFKYINACDNEKQIELFMETLKFVAKYFY